MPALAAAPVLEVVLVEVPDVPAAEAPAGELLDVPPTAPAALLEGLAEVLVLVRVAPPAPNVTAPVASCTLSGGGGTVIDELAPVVADVLLVPVALPLLAPVAPLLAPVAPPLLAAPRPVELLVAPVADVLAPVAAHCGLAPAPETPAGLVDADETGAALPAGRVEAPAATLVLGAAEAPVLVDGADPGAAPWAPQAASTSEAAASVGSSAFNDMDSSACPTKRA